MTEAFAEASKTAVAEGRKWKRYACRIFLCRMFKVFVLFTIALADFCRLVWLTRKSISIKWFEFLSHLCPTWPTTYWTTKSFTIVHRTFEFLEPERSHNIGKVIGADKDQHVCWLLLRHNTSYPRWRSPSHKRGNFKAILSHFNRELDKTAIIFEFLGKSFRNLAKLFLDRTFPLNWRFNKFFCLLKSMGEYHDAFCQQIRVLKGKYGQRNTRQAYLFQFLPLSTAVFDASANVFVCFHTGKRLI